MDSPREMAMAPVERLVFFSDAAVAIALTLLILPLMDAVYQAGRAEQDALTYLSENSSALISFVLSFVIISRFWRAHHRLFTVVERETPGLFSLNMAWLAAIVLLPVATAMTGSLAPDRVEYAIYIGTMAAASVFMTAMTWLLRHHPETWTEGRSVPARGLRYSLSMVVLLLVSLTIALTVPGAGYWSLLALFGLRPLNWALDHLLQDHPAPRPPQG